MNDVVKLTTFVTDVNEWIETCAAYNAVFEEMFDGNYPTNTLIGCAALIRPSLKIDIETTCVF
jgi:enamine deaminase RidA (YjgF/YER057c/UK114 family)